MNLTIGLIYIGGCLIGATSGIIIIRKLAKGMNLYAAIYFGLVVIRGFVAIYVINFTDIPPGVGRGYITAPFDSLLIGWNLCILIYVSSKRFKDRKTQNKL